MLTQEDIIKYQVMITRNGKKHCTIGLSDSGEMLGLLRRLYQKDVWDIRKIKSEGEENETNTY